MEAGAEVDPKESTKTGLPKKDGVVGIPAEMKEVAAGAKVKVFLAPGKGGGPIGAIVKKKNADGATVEVAPANRPQIRMVVILEPAPEQKRKR